MNVRNSLFPFGLAVALVVASCGYNPDTPVYDTAQNPKNFPPQAVRLLEDIEAQKLMDFESVALRFEQLYGDHIELLDNHDWADVVLKLGTKFRSWADSLVKEGIPKYYQAGGLYALASFARPDDSRVREQKELLETWREAVETGPPASLFADPTTAPTLAERIELAKSFVLADSLHRAFAREYLTKPLFSSVEVEWLRPQALQQLRAADQAFLEHAGLARFEFESPLATFDSGRVELIDCLMTPVDSNQYRIEAYFIARDSIKEDLGVLFRIESPEATPYTVEHGGRSWAPYDFGMLAPSNTWPVNSVAVAVQVVYYDGSAVPTLIGLMALDSQRPRVIGVDSPRGDWFELPPIVFPQTAIESTR